MISRVTACVIVLLADAGICRAASVDHSVFDKILSENVRFDRVDYANIKAKSMRDLNNYLDLLAIVDVSKLSRNEQLAFYLNVYNANVVKAVIQRYHPGVSVADDDFAMFKEPLVRLKSGAMSL